MDTKYRFMTTLQYLVLLMASGSIVVHASSKTDVYACDRYAAAEQRFVIDIYHCQFFLYCLCDVIEAATLTNGWYFLWSWSFRCRDDDNPVSFIGKLRRRNTSMTPSGAICVVSSFIDAIIASWASINRAMTPLWRIECLSKLHKPSREHRKLHISWWPLRNHWCGCCH